MPLVLLTGYSGGPELGEVIAEFCAPVIIVYWVVLAAALTFRRWSGEARRRAAPPAPGSPWDRHAPLSYPSRWQRIIVTVCTLASGALALIMLVQLHDAHGSFQSKLKSIVLTPHDIDYLPPWIALWAAIGTVALALNRRAWKDPTPPNFQRASRTYLIFWVHLAMLIFTAACSFFFELRRAY